MKIPYLHSALILILSCIVVTLALVIMSFVRVDQMHREEIITSKDSIVSQQAFLKVYSVLMSPRCMNCHPAGNVPLQGEDSHLHTQGVKRGIDGKGVYALKCTNCHQEQNTPGLNMPPGVEDWHLPPADMPMVFQGKSARDLAMQLKNRNQNGNKSLDDLIQHMDTDLVKWAWEPGEGRSKPPLEYSEFVDQLKLWIDNGAVVPAERTN